MTAVLAPGLERRLKAEIAGEVLFSSFDRGRYATDASHYQVMPVGVVVPHSIGDVTRAIALARQEGVSVLRARRRHLAGRPDRQHVAGDRLLPQAQPHPRPRRRRAALRGRARHRARRTQSPAQAARPVVSGRHLDRVARDHRRHGRQQLLRRALAALRQHARERPLDRRGAGRRNGRAFRSGGERSLRCAGRRCGRWRAICSRSARARRTKIAARFPKVQRRVGGYNLDALIPTRNDLNLAHILVGSEGTLAFSTRDRAQAVAAARPARRRRLPFRQLSRRHGCGPAHRQAQPDRGRAGRSNHDRARARHRDVPSDDRAFVRGAIRRRCCWSSSPSPSGTRTCAGSSSLHDLIGDARLCLGQDRRACRRRRRRARSQAAGGDHRGAHRRASTS